MLHLLFDAIAREQYHDVVGLLAQDTSLVQSVNPAKETPLHRAAQQDSVELIRLLLSHGANPTARDHLGRTPLMAAVIAGKAAMVRILAEHTRRMVQSEDGYGITPLMQAVEDDNEAVCEALLDNGALVDALDSQGQTALHLAAERGYVGMGKLLLAYGANIDAYTRLTGQTPYHMAEENDREAFMQMLKENCAAVHLPVRKPTPLQLQQELANLLHRSQALSTTASQSQRHFARVILLPPPTIKVANRMAQADSVSPGRGLASRPSSEPEDEGEQSQSLLPSPL